MLIIGTSRLNLDYLKIAYNMAQVNHFNCVSCDQSCHLHLVTTPLVIFKANVMLCMKTVIQVNTGFKNDKNAAKTTVRYTDASQSKSHGCHRL